MNQTEAQPSYMNQAEAQHLLEDDQPTYMNEDEVKEVAGEEQPAYINSSSSRLGSPLHAG
jgi:hypothetical protein